MQSLQKNILIVGMLVLLPLLFLSPNLFAADIYFAQTAAGSAEWNFMC